MKKKQKLGIRERIALLNSSAPARRKCFQGLINHLVSGFSIDCYGEVSEKTIEEFLVRYPDEFVLEELQDAMRRGKAGWERIGRQQADGSCMGNSRSWQYNMINRYKWTDRTEVKSDVNSNVSIQVISYADSKPSPNTQERD